jgi:hypothetical protein
MLGGGEAQGEAGGALAGGDGAGPDNLLADSAHRALVVKYCLKIKVCLVVPQPEKQKERGATPLVGGGT